MPEADGVLQRIAAARSAVSDVAGCGVFACSNGEIRDAVADMAALRASAEAVFLALVRVLAARPDAVAGARAGQVAATFLTHATHAAPGQTGRDVAAAHALDPDTGCLPLMGAARVDAFLTGTARELSPMDTERVAAQLLAVLDPDGADRFDPDAITRRGEHGGRLDRDADPAGGVRPRQRRPDDG